MNANAVLPTMYDLKCKYLTTFHCRTGVYYERKCTSKFPNHGALVVGFGTSDEGKDYWTVKNR